MIIFEDSKKCEYEEDTNIYKQDTLEYFENIMVF